MAIAAEHESGRLIKHTMLLTDRLQHIPVIRHDRHETLVSPDEWRAAAALSDAIAKRNHTTSH